MPTKRLMQATWSAPRTCSAPAGPPFTASTPVHAVVSCAGERAEGIRHKTRFPIVR